jgi:hypothetical protein
MGWDWMRWGKTRKEREKEKKVMVLRAPWGVLGHQPQREKKKKINVTAPFHSFFLFVWVFEWRNIGRKKNGRWAEGQTSGSSNGEPGATIFCFFGFVLLMFFCMCSVPYFIL